ncbi:MAG: flagellar biosynthesis protein FlhF [Treponema sp.]|jgi:flagellar biosynthesis protein FlhF|nr:flagellar biosynthesis protein FlhF [Treponema sp.]
METRNIYFTEQARTREECEDRIHQKYGPHVFLGPFRTVWRGGFFGIGGHEEWEVSGKVLPPENPLRGKNVYANAPPSKPLDFETERQKILAAQGKSGDSKLEAVLKELRSLSAKVEESKQPPVIPRTAEHETLKKLEEDLLLNDFSYTYIRNIMDRLRRETPLEQLDDYDGVKRNVIKWIGESISIYDSEAQHKKRPRIIVLVGPTGVGKTTTIAKMGAFYGERSEGEWQKEVRLVTLDVYRIGGKQQIEKYGEIMEIPVSVLEGRDDLKQVLELYSQDIDYILIDTIGKSPKNYSELGDMRSVLDACPARAECYLCIQAATKASDITEILRQFEPFNYRAVIITKLDETERTGNIISALAEAKKSAAFITDGQTVPSDLEKASRRRFLINLEGFVVDEALKAQLFS